MLKRAVLKEELVALTGDYRLALPLNQMIYWSVRVKDYNKFIEEERRRWTDTNSPSEYWWIYKKSEQLSEETLMHCDTRTMRTYLRKLVARGWLLERANPVFNWDKTKQYRVNLVKIHQDLRDLGYELVGYKHNLTEFFSESINEEENDIEKSHSAQVETVQKNPLIGNGKKENPTDKTIAATDKLVIPNGNAVAAIPEITSEIKIEIKQNIVEIISYLNDKTLKNYLPTSKIIEALIQSRWNEGYRRKDFFKVIDIKTADWLYDDRMNKYLRPSTLFGEKFDDYLNEERRPGNTAFDEYIKGLE